MMGKLIAQIESVHNSLTDASTILTAVHNRTPERVERLLVVPVCWTDTSDE